MDKINPDLSDRLTFVGRATGGCEKVAGGRSEAKTSGHGLMIVCTLCTGASRLAPCQGAPSIWPVTGGLRPPATIFYASGVLGASVGFSIVPLNLKVSWRRTKV